MTIIINQVYSRCDVRLLALRKVTLRKVIALKALRGADNEMNRDEWTEARLQRWFVYLFQRSFY